MVEKANLLCSRQTSSYLGYSVKFLRMKGPEKTINKHISKHVYVLSRNNILSTWSVKQILVMRLSSFFHNPPCKSRCSNKNTGKNNRAASLLACHNPLTAGYFAFYLTAICILFLLFAALLSQESF